MQLSAICGHPPKWGTPTALHNFLKRTRACAVSTPAMIGFSEVAYLVLCWLSNEILRFKQYASSGWNWYTARSLVRSSSNGRDRATDWSWLVLIVKIYHLLMEKKWHKLCPQRLRFFTPLFLTLAWDYMSESETIHTLDQQGEGRVHCKWCSSLEWILLTASHVGPPSHDPPSGRQLTVSATNRFFFIARYWR